MLVTLSAVLVMLGLTAGIGVTPASASVPAPDAIAEYILNYVGSWALGQYTCNGDITCYIEGSYDPARWGRGSVMTGGPDLRRPVMGYHAVLGGPYLSGRLAADYFLPDHGRLGLRPLGLDERLGLRRPAGRHPEVCVRWLRFHRIERLCGSCTSTNYGVSGSRARSDGSAPARFMSGCRSETRGVISYALWLARE